MSSRNSPRNLDALAQLHDIQEQYGTVNIVVAIRNLFSQASAEAYHELYASLMAYMKRFTTAELDQAYDILLQDHFDAPIWVTGRKLLCDDPSKWFRGTQIDERDLSLINSSHGSIPWVQCGEDFLFQVRHLTKDQPWTEVRWDCENDEALGSMIFEVGAEFNGFAMPPVRHPASDWMEMCIVIPVTVNSQSETDFSGLQERRDIRPIFGLPSKTRVLAGPRETVCDALCENCEDCTRYTWDIMIIRDAYLNEGISSVPSVESRQFDILLMKFCGFNYPWRVLAVKDSGPKDEGWHPF